MPAKLFPLIDRRITIVRKAPIAGSVRSATNANNVSSAKVKVLTVKLAPRQVEIARAAIRATASNALSANSITPSRTAVPTAVTRRQIPIRLSPSWRRSSSNSSKTISRNDLDRQRVDKWLWHARMVRTRSDAAALTEAGYVRLNGKRITAPSHQVQIGDVVTLALDRSVKVIRVDCVCERRGPAAAARSLYSDMIAKSATRT